MLYGEYYFGCEVYIGTARSNDNDETAEALLLFAGLVFGIGR